MLASHRPANDDVTFNDCAVVAFSVVSRMFSSRSFRGIPGGASPVSLNESGPSFQIFSMWCVIPEQLFMRSGRQGNGV